MTEGVYEALFYGTGEETEFLCELKDTVQKNLKPLGLVSHSEVGGKACVTCGPSSH